MGLLPGFVQSCTSRFRWGSLIQRLEVGTCLPTWPYLERWNWWKIRFNIWTTVPKKTLSSPVCFVWNAPLLTSTRVVDVWYLWIVYCSNQFTSIGWLVGWLHYIKVHFFLHLFFFTVILLPLCMSKPKLCWLKHFRSLNLLGMFLLQNLKSDSDFFSQLVAFERPKSPRIRFILGLKSYPWRIHGADIYIYIC